MPYRTYTFRNTVVLLCYALVNSQIIKNSQCRLIKRSSCFKSMRRTAFFLAERTSPPVRRTVLQQQRPVRQSPMGKVNDVMVQQVKDVLPQVPIDVIRRDIGT